MTATMPEEDLEVAGEKAEQCEGRRQWNGHGAVHHPCALPAEMEALGHCTICGSDFRRAHCLPHHRGLLASFERFGTLLCTNCITDSVVLVAVLPL